MPFTHSGGRFRDVGLSVIAAVGAVLFAFPQDPSKMNPHDGLTYQWIPPGDYVTGCLPEDSECYGLERQRQKVVIAHGFWISQTEVTQAAYKRVMDADPSRYKGADLPVDSVGWMD